MISLSQDFEYWYTVCEILRINTNYKSKSVILLYSTVITMEYSILWNSLYIGVQVYISGGKRHQHLFWFFGGNWKIKFYNYIGI